VRGLGDAVHDSCESVVMPFYLPDEPTTKLAKITREFHIVNDLDCKVLTRNDIIIPERIDISLARRRISIGSCGNMTCSIRVTPCTAKVSKHPVRSASSIAMPPNRTAFIPIRFAELKGYHDYVFTQMYVLQTIVSSNQEGIFVTNVGDTEATIKKGCRIGHISIFYNGAASTRKRLFETIKTTPFWTYIAQNPKPSSSKPSEDEKKEAPDKSKDTDMAVVPNPRIKCFPKICHCYSGRTRTSQKASVQ